MIQITDKYYIKPEESSFTVCEKQINRKGETIYKSISYLPSFTKAIETVMKYEQSAKLSEKDITLFEALEILKGINEDFKKTLEVYIQAYEFL